LLSLLVTSGLNHGDLSRNPQSLLSYWLINHLSILAQKLDDQAVSAVNHVMMHASIYILHLMLEKLAALRRIFVVNLSRSGFH